MTEISAREGQAGKAGIGPVIRHPQAEVLVGSSSCQLSLPVCDFKSRRYSAIKMDIDTSTPDTQNTSHTQTSKHILRYHYIHSGGFRKAVLYATLTPRDHSSVAFDEVLHHAPTCHAWTEELREACMQAAESAQNPSDHAQSAMHDSIVERASELVLTAGLDANIHVQVSAVMTIDTSQKIDTLLPHLSVALGDTRRLKLRRLERGPQTATATTVPFDPSGQTTPTSSRLVLSHSLKPRTQPRNGIAVTRTSGHYQRVPSVGNSVRLVLHSRLGHPYLLEELLAKVQSTLSLSDPDAKGLEPLQTATLVNDTVREMAAEWKAMGLSIIVAETPRNMTQMRAIIDEPSAPETKFVVELSAPLHGGKSCTPTFHLIAPLYGEDQGETRGRGQQKCNGIVPATRELWALLGKHSLGLF